MRKKKVETNTEIPYKEKIKTKQFKECFVPSGEILRATVKSCSWRPELANTTAFVMQVDYDFYMAVDFQDDSTPWLRYGFLSQNIEILKNE